MIGGIDVSITTQAAGSSFEVAVRAIKQLWRRAVFKNGVTGDRYDSFHEIPFGNLEELFVYRDCASADAWEEEGAIPENFNTMIHILPDVNMLTLVIDEKDAAMEQILSAVRSGLSDPILHIPVAVAA